MRGHSPAVRPFDVNEIEGEIHEAVQQKPPRIQAVGSIPRALAVPEYVSHRDDATEIVKLSAAVIAREWAWTDREHHTNHEIPTVIK
jgi:hypothetical protein